MRGEALRIEKKISLPVNFLSHISHFSFYLCTFARNI
jgi:hypothetical protein